MSKFGCVCGHVMNLSQEWQDYELSLVPEAEIALIGEELLSPSSLTEEGFYARISARAKQVYICPACGRLHLETEGGFNSYIAEGGRGP